MLPGDSSSGGRSSLPNMPDSGAWWDPRTWSAGGQKTFGGPQYGGSAPGNIQPNPQFAGSVPGAGNKAGKESLGKSTSAPTENDAMAARQAQWDAFFAELNAPFDPDTPENQLILKDIRAGTLQGANNQGIFGGYSNAMAEQALAKANAGMAMQKKGMALSALGGATNYANNTRDFKYGVEQDKYTNQMDLWKFDQGNKQSWGGLAGGLFGAAAGGLIGGPGGAMAGYQVGSGLGSAFGGANNSPPSYKPGGF